MGSMSPCNIAGLISNVSKEVATQIAKKCSAIDAPAQWNPREYPHTPYIRKLVIGLHFCC